MQAAIFCVECGDIVGEVDGYEGQPMRTLITVAKTLKPYSFRGGTYRVVCLECIRKQDSNERKT
jgi:ribosomal protein S27E